MGGCQTLAGLGDVAKLPGDRSECISPVGNALSESTEPEDTLITGIGINGRRKRKLKNKKRQPVVRAGESCHFKNMHECLDQ